MKELLAQLLVELANFQASLEIETKNAYDAGFVAGAASVSVPPVEGEKTFTQAEMDAAISPLNDKINELNASVMALQADFDSKVAEAVAAKKVELLAPVTALVMAELEAIKELLK